jgi:hypothetical protein
VVQSSGDYGRLANDLTAHPITVLGLYFKYNGDTQVVAFFVARQEGSGTCRGLRAWLWCCLFMLL